MDEIHPPGIALGIFSHRIFQRTKHHVVNLGYLLDLKRSAGGLDKVLHVITVGYVYKM